MSKELMSDLTALQKEFGLRFALTNPDEKVTAEQRTINNLFFALLEARHEFAAMRGDEPPLFGPLLRENHIKRIVIEYNSVGHWVVEVDVYTPGGPVAYGNSHNDDVDTAIRDAIANANDLS